MHERKYTYYFHGKGLPISEKEDANVSFLSESDEIKPDSGNEGCYIIKFSSDKLLDSEDLLIQKNKFEKAILEQLEDKISTGFKYFVQIDYVEGDVEFNGKKYDRHTFSQNVALDRFPNERLQEISKIQLEDPSKEMNFKNSINFCIGSLKAANIENKRLRYNCAGYYCNNSIAYLENYFMKVYDLDYTDARNKMYDCLNLNSDYIEKREKLLDKVSEDIDFTKNDNIFDFTCDIFDEFIDYIASLE